MKTKKRNERRKVSNKSLTNNNGNFIKNLSEEVLTDTQISLLTKGLKFIPTATEKKNKIKRQLLQDYIPTTFPTYLWTRFFKRVLLLIFS